MALERQSSPPLDYSVNGHKESLLDTSSLDSNRVVSTDNYSSAESQSKVASLINEAYTRSMGVARRKDPPNDDHHQCPTGPTADLSGSKASEQTHNSTEISSVSDPQSGKWDMHPTQSAARCRVGRVAVHLLVQIALCRGS